MKQSANLKIVSRGECKVISARFAKMFYLK